MKHTYPSATLNEETDPRVTPPNSGSCYEDLPQRPVQWYVVRTEPQADHLAASELGQIGFEVFAPRVKTAASAGRNTEVPLFPGYLFLRCDLDSEGRPSLKGVPHVSGWLHFNGVVPPVPDEVISGLSQRVNALNSRGGLWRRFHPGDRVRVMSNNLESLAEVVSETRSPSSRVRVLMEFMGRLVPVQVPWQDLQAIEDNAEPRSSSRRRTRGRGRWIQGFSPGPRQVSDRDREPTNPRSSS